MKHLITLALLIALPAFATNKPQQPENEANATATSGSSAVSGSKSRSVSGAFVENRSTVSVGDTTVTGGSGGNGGQGGEGGQGGSVGDISAGNTNYKRNAPSVTVIPGQSTAPFMKCIGLGGSNQNGSATGAWCWIQRDAFALSQWEELSRLNLPEPAAEARCQTKLLWKPFGSKENCLATMTQVVIEQHLNDGVVDDPKP